MKTKRLFSILLFIHLYTPLLIGQNKFRDYQLTLKLDSLQNEIRIHKKDKDKYLYLLIELEKSRINFSDKFGKDLETINRLSKSNPNLLARAMYNYLKGHYEISNNLVNATKHVTEAYNYFESTQDTSGMMNCHAKFIAINLDSFLDRIGSYKNAKENYDKFVKLGSVATNLDDKIYYLYLTSRLNSRFYPAIPSHETINNLNKALQYAKSNMQYNYYIPLIYSTLGLTYSQQKQYDNCILYFNRELKYLTKDTSTHKTSAYNNIAAAYYFQGKKDTAILYFNKILQLFNHQKKELFTITIQAYNSLADIYYEEQDYEHAWAYRNKKDSLFATYNEQLNAKAMLELQTFYETEKKESEIKDLTLKKQLAENQKQQFLVGLLLAVFILIIVIFLLFLLRKSNQKLKRLSLFRDKLFSIISHDLRTPLAAYQDLGESISYLLKTNQFHRINEITQQIEATGQHLQFLLENLLEWSKSQLELLSPQKQPLVLAEWLNKNTPIYITFINHKGGKMKIIGTLSRAYFTDINMFSVIVRNVLDNAVKNTPSEGVVVVELTEDDHYGYLNITNDIYLNAKDKIQSMVKKIENIDTTLYDLEDVGLGLLLIKNYAKQLDIKIQCTLLEDDTTPKIRFTIAIENNYFFES